MESKEKNKRSELEYNLTVKQNKQDTHHFIYKVLRIPVSRESLGLNFGFNSMSSNERSIILVLFYKNKTLLKTFEGLPWWHSD